jgi:hypothetical protein
LFHRNVKELHLDRRHVDPNSCTNQMGGHTNHQTPAERVVGNRTAHGELAVSVDAVLELEQEVLVVLVA